MSTRCSKPTTPATPTGSSGRARPPRPTPASGPDNGRATRLELDHVVASDVRVSYRPGSKAKAHTLAIESLDLRPQGERDRIVMALRPRSAALEGRRPGRPQHPLPRRQGGLAVRPEARHRGRDAGRGRHARYRAAHRRRRGRRVGQGRHGGGPGPARRRGGGAALASGAAHDPALGRRQAARRPAPPRARRPGDRRPRHAERPAGAPAPRRRAGGEGDRRRQAARRRAGGEQALAGSGQGRRTAVRRHAAAAARRPAADRDEDRPRDQAAATCPTCRRCRR